MIFEVGNLPQTLPPGRYDTKILRIEGFLEKVILEYVGPHNPENRGLFVLTVEEPWEHSTS